MKTWSLKVEIESEDGFSARAILKKLDLLVNTGDGIYMGVTPKTEGMSNPEIQLLKIGEDRD